MNVKIRNDKITLEASTVGAELMSIKYGGREYLWQGDPDIWDDRAPVLFPFCGRQTEASYLYKGKKYEMGIHGFLWKSDMTVKEQTDTSVTFLLTDNEETRKIYPFAFSVEVGYSLSDSSITNSIRIENTGDERMYFTHGYHPGFNFPFDEGEDFSDCYIEFKENAEPLLVEMSGTSYLVTENYPPFPLTDGKYLFLTHELFDRQSVFMKNMSRELTVKSKKSEHSVTVSFPECEILGLWQAANKNANYLCIEPWNGLPDVNGRLWEISERLCERSLLPGEVYENAITITVK